MTYDTQSFYNNALAILAGSIVPPIAFRLIPPLSSAFRTRRLLRFALHDLRRIAAAHISMAEDWESRIYSRIIALPDDAEPLQRAQLLAALSVGNEIIELRRMFPLFGGTGLDPALASIAEGDSALAKIQLARLDSNIASYQERGVEPAAVVRARAGLLVISEALAHHAEYFDAGVQA
jgi:hypothetical protein